MSDPAHPRPWVVFADDWGRHPSSAQHLVRELLPGREVVWVNTIGTRPPRLDWSTAKRAAGKLAGWLRPGGAPAPAEAGPAPRIVSPKMWPSFRSRFGRGLNRRLLVRALRPVFAEFSTPPVVVTTLPLVADLVTELPGRWVYYCVDDFSAWPGYDGDTMRRMEADLVPKVDACIAVSDELVTHLAGLGARAELLTHGVDLAHWHAVPIGQRPAEFAGLTGPVVLFWGVIDCRLDLAIVRQLAATLPTANLVFVGPREDPDPELTAVPNVHLRPSVPFARLPALAAAADVLVMPYADLPVTRAMQPLKMKEYLATGKPVVVRALPATRPWADALDAAETPDGFAAAVRDRLQHGVPAEQARARERLAGEGWAAKAERFAEWVEGSS